METKLRKTLRTGIPTNSSHNVTTAATPILFDFRIFKVYIRSMTDQDPGQRRPITPPDVVPHGPGTNLVESSWAISEGRIVYEVAPGGWSNVLSTDQSDTPQRPLRRIHDIPLSEEFPDEIT